MAEITKENLQKDLESVQKQKEQFNASFGVLNGIEQYIKGLIAQLDKVAEAPVTETNSAPVAQTQQAA